jgi:drug/metabolite transporter (DMT)-like permease
MAMAIDRIAAGGRQRHRVGVGLVAGSAVAYSTAGFFTRLIALDVWTMLFWRGLAAGLFIAGCIVWRHRRGTLAAVRAIGVSGVLAAACSTAATVCFINALRLTAVADVMVIGAAAPFAAAALDRLFTGGRERRTTLVASLVALAGVALMMGAAGPAGRSSAICWQWS